MKPKIEPATKAGIADFLPTFQGAIAELQTVAEKNALIAAEIVTNSVKQDQLNAVEMPSDREFTSILVVRERAHHLDSLAGATESAGMSAKAKLARLAQQAAELVHRAIAKQAEQQVEADLIESLPESIRADKSLLFRLTNESSRKQATGKFLNPPPLSQRDEAETVLAEARRLAQLLADIMEGNEIALPGGEVAATS